MASSGGFAQYRNFRTEDNPQPNKKTLFIDDLSRLVLLVIILLATVAGYFFQTHINNPANLIRSSIKKTLGSPYSASIEGRCAVGDSVIASYRSRELFKPGEGLKTISAPGDIIPETTHTLLERFKKVRVVKELDREDMYGHPTRHFYGKIDGGLCGNGSISYFEYWLDFRDGKAVRLIMSSVVRDVAVKANGDSLSRETSVNILFRR